MVGGSKKREGAVRVSEIRHGLTRDEGEDFHIQGKKGVQRHMRKIPPGQPGANPKIKAGSLHSQESRSRRGDLKTRRVKREDHFARDEAGKKRRMLLGVTGREKTSIS